MSSFFSPDFGDLTAPFPDGMINSAGWGFYTGLVCGAFYEAAESFCNKPKGNRINLGLQALLKNGPRFGGEVAVWSTLMYAVEGTVCHFRKKERDPGSFIISGATVGGLYRIRRGFCASFKGAAFDGLMFTIITGIFIYAEKYYFPPETNDDDMPHRPLPSAASEVAPKWPCLRPSRYSTIIHHQQPLLPLFSSSPYSFGGLFSAQKHQVTSTGITTGKGSYGILATRRIKRLENYDAPPARA